MNPAAVFPPSDDEGRGSGLSTAAVLFDHATSGLGPRSRGLFFVRAL